MVISLKPNKSGQERVFNELAQGNPQALQNIIPKTLTPNISPFKGTTNVNIAPSGVKSSSGKIYGQTQGGGISGSSTSSSKITMSDVQKSQQVGEQLKTSQKEQANIQQRTASYAGRLELGKGKQVKDENYTTTEYTPPAPGQTYYQKNVTKGYNIPSLNVTAVSEQQQKTESAATNLELQLAMAGGLTGEEKSSLEKGWGFMPVIQSQLAKLEPTAESAIKPNLLSSFGMGLVADPIISSGILIERVTKPEYWKAAANIVGGGTLPLAVAYYAKGTAESFFKDPVRFSAGVVGSVLLFGGIEKGAGIVSSKVRGFMPAEAIAKVDLSRATIRSVSMDITPDSTLSIGSFEVEGGKMSGLKGTFLDTTLSTQQPESFAANTKTIIPKQKIGRATVSGAISDFAIGKTKTIGERNFLLAERSQVAIDFSVGESFDVPGPNLIQRNLMFAESGSISQFKLFKGKGADVTLSKGVSMAYDKSAIQAFKGIDVNVKRGEIGFGMDKTGRMDITGKVIADKLQPPSSQKGFALSSSPLDFTENAGKGASTVIARPKSVDVRISGPRSSVESLTGKAVKTGKPDFTVGGFGMPKAELVEEHELEFNTKPGDIVAFKSGMSLGLALKTDLMQQQEQKQKDRVGFKWGLGLQTMQETRQQPIINTAVKLGMDIGQAQKQRQMQDQTLKQLTTLRNPPPTQPFSRLLRPPPSITPKFPPPMFRMGGRSDLRMGGFTPSKRKYHYLPGFIERTMDLHGKVPKAVLESRQSAVGFRPIPMFTRRKKVRKKR